MREFKVIDSTGDTWGHIIEASAEAAIAWVEADAAANPDAYMGTPRGLRAIAA